MASIRKRGKSYLLIVSCGYDADHKKKTVTMTWKPPPGTSPVVVDQEAKRQAELFEQKVKDGHYYVGDNISFAEFVTTWLREHAEKQLRPKTVHWYRQMLLGRVVPEIGHIALSRLQPLHLIKLRNKLLEEDLNQHIRYRAKPGIRKIWKYSRPRHADGIERHTCTAVLTGQIISKKTASHFSALVGQKVDNVFEQVDDVRPLSGNTVRHYLRCVSAVLSVAVAWQLIESNPCRRVKLPKVTQKSIKFLEIDDAQKVVDAAMKLVDIRIRMAVLVFLYTGIRKGELTGLQWSDIDMNANTLSISRALQSIPGQGLVVSDPKTGSGKRMFSLSPDLIVQLRRYRTWQNQERLRIGIRWQRQAYEQAKAAGRAWQPVDWVFAGLDGYPLHPTTIYHKIKAFLKDNGHPDMTVHGLRHSNISLLLSQGVDLITAARRAGHAQPSTTANIYAHALRKPDIAAADIINDLFHTSVQAGEP